MQLDSSWVDTVYTRSLQCGQYISTLLVKAIRSARGEMVHYGWLIEQWPGLWCLTAASKGVTTREAGDVLQVALHHFAACSVLPYTRRGSDVRSNEHGWDHSAYVIPDKSPYQLQKWRTESTHQELTNGFNLLYCTTCGWCDSLCSYSTSSLRRRCGQHFWQSGANCLFGHFMIH